VDPKEKLYRLARKKIDEKILHGLDHGETRSAKIGRGVRHGCCLSRTVFSLYREYLTKETFKRFGDFKTRRQVIRTVKYADDFVLLPKKEGGLTGYD
jgi:hypothetical protein